MRTLKIVAISTLLVGVIVGAFPGYASSNPREVAEAYFAATTTSDLDAAGKLFADESSVYESGSVEAQAIEDDPGPATAVT